MHASALAVTIALSLSTLAAHAGISVEVVNSRKVELELVQSSAPKATVVFESGLRQTLKSWDKVTEAIKGDATAFAYNRPGYGKSEEAQTPREPSASISGS